MAVGSRTRLFSKRFCCTTKTLLCFSKKRKQVVCPFPSTFHIRILLHKMIGRFVFDEASVVVFNQSIALLFVVNTLSRLQASFQVGYEIIRIKIKKNKKNGIGSV